VLFGVLYRFFEPGMATFAQELKDLCIVRRLRLRRIRDTPDFDNQPQENLFLALQDGSWLLENRVPGRNPVLLIFPPNPIQGLSYLLFPFRIRRLTYGRELQQTDPGFASRRLQLL